MVICKYDGVGYKSDIECIIMDGVFIVETNPRKKQIININDGKKEAEVTLILTPEHFECRSAKEVSDLVKNLEKSGYLIPPWINDCIELSESVNLNG